MSEAIRHVSSTMSAIDFDFFKRNGIEKGDEYAFTFMYPPISALRLLNDVDLKQRSVQHGTASIYIHIPYCTGKCPFCYFQKIVDNKKADIGKDEYIELLKMEIQSLKRELNIPLITSINLGGGTPSCMTSQQINRIFEIIYSEFAVEQGCEVSFETSVETLTREKLIAMKHSGVNRITIGIQSLEPHILSMIKRRYTVDKVNSVLQLLREMEFDNINGDFMYGLPTQTLQDCQATIEKAISYDLESISFYKLRKHPKLAFSNYHQELFPNSSDVIAMQLLFKHLLAESGYVFASSHKYVKKSDNVLTQIKDKRSVMGTTLLGIGCSSYGYIGDQVYWNTRNITEYKERILSGKSAVWIGENLDSDALRRKAMILGIHLPIGIDISAFKKRFGDEPSYFFQDEMDTLQGLGLIEYADSHIKLTFMGQIFADEVAIQFYSPEIKKEFAKKGIKYGMFFEFGDYNERI